ncbi:MULTISPECIES: LlaJI family restriction endonuclease [unclassified Streptococcus]|uniref:LlaJI family restriction endonuclease n=1 Tax=unclassified Streptococcus TaxID=2608887 RepID=UPI0010716DDE|nr:MULTISPECIES: LlaJI family restriction endonuclease [unclassified Streptococcus]MBF0806700.1 LlaJI family restriction endonuclease [Streptococcus sp. 19428wA2_WM07]TFU26476.1 LlaJI family restriction endonuclease [Streptococcus sp. WM07]
MNNGSPICINDGEVYDKEKLNSFQIDDLLRYTNGTCTINFVGVVVSQGSTLFSFPKHFDHEKLSIEEKKEYAKAIASLLVKGSSPINFQKKDSKSNEFPVDSYLLVVDYYKKFGIYNKKIKVENITNQGRPNWKRTIRKSQKVIQDNGIVFLPIISIKDKNSSVFLSDCMQFILSNTYDKYSEILNFVLPYKEFSSDNIFKNFKACVRKLKLIKNRYFKDSEKELIQAMISYFEWLSFRNGVLAITTTDFPLYWESMIHVLLNKTFSGIDNDGIDLSNESTYKFIKQSEKTESCENREHSETQGFSIEFDHIYISDTEDEIILFDSKYMKSISELNYKQAFYYYFLKEKYPQSKIHNGLIAPTHGAPYDEVHIDRTWIEDVSRVKGYSDGLKIIVHYLNLKTVIDFTLSNIFEFKAQMRERSRSKG